MIRGRPSHGKVQLSLPGRHRRLWARTELVQRQDVEQQRRGDVVDAVAAVAGAPLVRRTELIRAMMRQQPLSVSAAGIARLCSMAES